MSLLLKISRPGLWFATLWLYLLPTSQMENIFYSTAFWIGLLYVTFPINLLVYGWNDLVDIDADKVNPRKGSFLFGAKANKKELSGLWKKIVLVQLLFIPYFTYLIGYKFIILFVAFCIINGLYNLPKHGLRSKPPLELICQFGYLLIVPMSIWINNTSELPLFAYIYLLLFAVQSHLIGEVMDIEPDRNAGKTTTATIIGMKATKWLIIALVSLEIIILTLVFKAYFFAAFLGLGLIWLFIDLLLLYKTKIYTVKEMKLFAYLSNVMAVTSMTYVWWSGCLSI